MLPGLVKDAGIRPAQDRGSAVASRPAAAPSIPAPAPQAAGPDPRSLEALTNALSAFLSEINGPAGGTSAAVDLRGAARAYAETLAAEEPAPGAVSHAPSTEASPFDNAFASLKESFDGLVYTMQFAANPAAPAAGAAERNSQMKASATHFVATLNTVVGAIERANAAAAGSAPAAASQPTQPAPQAVEQTPRAAESKPAQKPTLFSALAARVQQHFDEL